MASLDGVSAVSEQVSLQPLQALNALREVFMPRLHTGDTTDTKKQVVFLGVCGEESLLKHHPGRQSG